MAAYDRKTYAYKDGKQICFNGHIKAETAKRRGFHSVTLCVFDTSGKGRSEYRRFNGPEFKNMRPFY